MVDPLIGSSTVPANRQHELQIGDGFVTLMALGVPSVFRLVLPSARSGRDSPHNARAPSTASFAPEHIVTPMDGDMRAYTFVWNHPPYKRDTGGDESPHTWKAIVFLSLSRIRSFLDTSADRLSGFSFAAGGEREGTLESAVASRFFRTFVQATASVCMTCG